MIDLSIIIVSYNTKDLLKKCVDSVTEELGNSKITGEIIVADNASTDDSVKVAKGLGVSVIQNRENLGFGGANNLGAKRARGRYLLFLNPDTEVKSGALTKMVRFMDENPEAGIASCRLVNPDGSFQPQGGYLPRLTTVAVWALFLDDLPIIREILPSYQSRSKLRSGSCRALPRSDVLPLDSLSARSGCGRSTGTPSRATPLIVLLLEWS